MTPSFLSPGRNYNNFSMEDNQDMNDLRNSNSKNIINDYESRIKLLTESNNQIIKEVNEDHEETDLNEEKSESEPSVDN